MKRLAIAWIVVLGLSLSTAQAADEWGIDHEEKARFQAKVVDIVCELTSDCPANCGGGKRQLGLVREDGTLLLVPKNRDIFAGSASDLLPFCGKDIIADGLLIKNPKMPLFAIQFKRLAPDGKWSGATWFIRDWAKKNGVAADSKKAKQWYNNEATIKAVIAKDGVFGIPGLKPDKE